MDPELAQNSTPDIAPTPPTLFFRVTDPPGCGDQPPVVTVVLVSVFAGEEHLGLVAVALVMVVRSGGPLPPS